MLREAKIGHNVSWARITAMATIARGLLGAAIRAGRSTWKWDFQTPVAALIGRATKRNEVQTIKDEQL